MLLALTKSTFQSFESTKSHLSFSCEQNITSERWNDALNSMLPKDDPVEKTVIL